MILLNETIVIYYILVDSPKLELLCSFKIKLSVLATMYLVVTSNSNGIK